MKDEKLVEMVVNECEYFTKHKDMDIKVFISNIKFYIKNYKKRSRKWMKRMKNNA